MDGGQWQDAARTSLWFAFLPFGLVGALLFSIGQPWGDGASTARIALIGVLPVFQFIITMGWSMFHAAMAWEIDSGDKGRSYARTARMIVAAALWQGLVVWISIRITADV